MYSDPPGVLLLLYAIRIARPLIYKNSGYHRCSIRSVVGAVPYIYSDPYRWEKSQVNHR